MTSDSQFDPLTPPEQVFFRDQLRAARYAALANSEGFHEICFAVEALGLRLLSREGTLDKYAPAIWKYAKNALQFDEAVRNDSPQLKTYSALFEIVRRARNDAMHTGSYARHATQAAIELCIGLEEGLMMGVDEMTVGDLMVKSPITVEHWHTVAHARQLMLMHSFSFLPVCISKQWNLISEVALAKFLAVSQATRKERLGTKIDKAVGLELLRVKDEHILCPGKIARDVLRNTDVQTGPMLWLVVDKERSNHLAGVLSPFELM